MLKKLVYLVIFVAVSVVVLILTDSYYLSFLKDQKQPPIQSMPGEAEWVDFLWHKKESLKIGKGDVLPVSGGVIRQVVYRWNNDLLEFEKSVREVSGNSLNESEVLDSLMIEYSDSVTRKYQLDSGQLTIMENEEVVWRSVDNWWIDSFVLADSNNDGITDINLSLWKSGNFGTSKPFWIHENDMSVKNHFFILNFSQDSVRQVWGSSNLVVPNCEFQIADVDGDGHTDLVVIEGEYNQEMLCVGKYVAIWKWNSWGFTNIWRSEEGDFTNLSIEKNSDQSYIVVDTTNH